MRIFDSHCHLDHQQFDVDREAMFARAKAAGVSHIISIGSSDGLNSATNAISLSKTEAGVFPSAGIHPHDGGFDQGQAGALEALVAEPAVVAIGETGLDFFYDFAPRDGQLWWFEFQLSLAQSYNKPVIIHCRNAAQDVLKTIKKSPGVTGVFHCFTESTETAKAVLDLGWYISVPGIVTFNAAQPLRDTLAIVPLDKLLVETDAPFLAPIPKRGQRNESSFIVHTLAALAAIKQVSPENLAEQTFLNTVDLFKLHGKI